jgi:hypothetical protein
MVNEVQLKLGFVWFPLKWHLTSPAEDTQLVIGGDGSLLWEPIGNLGTNSDNMYMDGQGVGEQ